jgi:phosphate transport system permease protein
VSSAPWSPPFDPWSADPEMPASSTGGGGSGWAGDPVVDDEPHRPTDNASSGDRIFRGLATACAGVSLVIVGMTFVFLLWESRQAFRATGVVNFFTDSVWNASFEKFGVAGLVMGTFLIASIALVVAVPLSLGMAMFINEYAPRRIRVVLTSVVDLLAALPSLIYGMWGLQALQPRVQPVSRWFGEHLSALPIFRIPNIESNLTSSSFVVGIIVGVMITPIITSVSRDVMAQVPRDQCEGALALGGTRWGMIREVVLPFGRSGIVGATLLGFGRALGETIAVTLVISLSVNVNWHVLTQGGGSIASHIVTRFGEASELERSGLIAAGLALFAITFGVNLVSRRIVASVGQVG